MAASNEMIRPVILSRPENTAVAVPDLVGAGRRRAEHQPRCRGRRPDAGRGTGAAKARARRGRKSQPSVLVRRRSARARGPAASASRWGGVSPVHVANRGLIRRPGVVVAAGRRARARPQHRARAAGRRRACRSCSARRASPIRAACNSSAVGTLVGQVVQPAVPAGRRRRALAFARVDHPAPLEAERRVDRAADRAVIDVAELVVADASPKRRV